MRWCLLLLATAALNAQDDSRIEVSASAWPAAITGTLSARGLPVDLHSDLNLRRRTTFFGKLAIKPGRRHRILIEGAPYSFEGDATVTRAVTYNGTTFPVADRLASQAGMTSLLAGYQYLNADIRENSAALNPAGIAPRIQGPIFSLQFRR